MVEFPDRKKLIELLSPFTKSFGEIQEIMRVEEEWMDKLEECIKKIYNNAFIEDCDEYGIKKYEDLLGILPESKDKLETRKIRVLARWNSMVPYTYRTLVQQLNILCGVNNYDIDSDLENYMISFSIYGKEDTSEIKQQLDRILPVNIAYDVRSTEGYGCAGATGIVCQYDEIFTLRQVVI